MGDAERRSFKVACIGVRCASNVKELCKDPQRPLRANMIDSNIKNGLIKCVCGSSLHQRCRYRITEVLL